MFYAKKVKSATKEENKKKTKEFGKIKIVNIILMVLIWILSIIIIAQSCLYSKIISNLKGDINNEQEQLQQNNIESEKIIIEDNYNSEVEENNKKEYAKDKEKIVATEVGKLTIPDIGLNEETVYEGTELEILDIGVEHFTNTSIYSGNIGLASHNSGGKGDKFKNLKNIKIGSKIIYQTQYGTREYSVQTINEISDEDWSYLIETKDNRITLLTCVSGKPNNRLCVQGVETL